MLQPVEEESGEAEEALAPGADLADSQLPVWDTPFVDMRFPGQQPACCQRCGTLQ